MGMMGAGVGQIGFDGNAAFRQERELLNIVKYNFEGDLAEKRLLGERYPDMQVGARAHIDLSR
jgi:hypothetical protein